MSICQERDAYGNEVGVSARRLPVAYLLVDVPCGLAASSASPVFSPRADFPPAHRPLQKHLQTLKALHEHLQRSETFLEVGSYIIIFESRITSHKKGVMRKVHVFVQAMSDLHVLLWLASNETLSLSEEALEPLLQAVRTRDAAAAARWRETPAFATLESLARHAADDPAPAARSLRTPHTKHIYNVVT